MAATDIHGALRQIAPDNLAPVYVFIGEERFLVDRATHKVRAAVLHGGVEGFNDDVFHGKGLDAKRFVSAARTLPMMASMRFVLIRDVDGAAASELDALADYLENPSATTAVVMTADKLDGRSRFAKVAKKASYWIDAKPIKASGARTFVTAEAKERGHKLTPDAADALVDALGTDLAALDDALERLSLYVGKGQAIDLQAVEASVTRIRTESIWAMVDAVSMRDARTALHATGSLLADREPPLRILAMVTRQLRIVAKMREALASGLRGQDATKEAGAPPFKARELTEAARRFRTPDLARAFAILAETDMALKGSKRPPGLILEEAVLALCADTRSSAA